MYPRPRGRPPKGKDWDTRTGRYVQQGMIHKRGSGKWKYVSHFVPLSKLTTQLGVHIRHTELKNFIMLQKRFESARLSLFACITHFKIQLLSFKGPCSYLNSLKNFLSALERRMHSFCSFVESEFMFIQSCLELCSMQKSINVNEHVHVLYIHKFCKDLLYNADKLGEHFYSLYNCLNIPNAFTDMSDARTLPD